MLNIQSCSKKPSVNFNGELKDLYHRSFTTTYDQDKIAIDKILERLKANPDCFEITKVPPPNDDNEAIVIESKQGKAAPNHLKIELLHNKKYDSTFMKDCLIRTKDGDYHYIIIARGLAEKSMKDLWEHVQESPVVSVFNDFIKQLSGQENCS